MKLLFKTFYYALIVGIGLIGMLLLSTLTPIANFQVKIVQSGSMEPSIRTGGIVIIRPAKSYQIGEIVTFGADNREQVPTTHRIVESRSQGGRTFFTTKGDANDVADPQEVAQSEVAGKVILSLPYVGYLLDFAKRPLGFALLVGLPALLVITDELRKIWRELKRMKSEKGSPIKPLILLALLLPASFGLWQAGGTISYYRENELSSGNLLQAASSFPSVETFSRQSEAPAELTEAESTKAIDATEPEIANVEVEEAETEKETEEVLAPPEPPPEPPPEQAPEQIVEPEIETIE